MEGAQGLEAVSACEYDASAQRRRAFYAFACMCGGGDGWGGDYEV